MSLATESVWDYPRPPRVEPTDELVVITQGGELVARSTRALRVLETSHPPTYYLPAADFTEGALRPSRGASWCEWKGRAAYYDVVGAGLVAAAAAWGYPDPVERYRLLRDHVAVYPGRVGECRVAGERVRPQAGDFYGGWVTGRVTGPFKGKPGTQGW